MTSCRSLPPFFTLACLWPAPKDPCGATWDTKSPGHSCLERVTSSTQGVKRPAKAKHPAQCYKGKESDKKHPEKFLSSLVIGKNNWTAQSYRKQFAFMLQTTDLLLKVMIALTSQKRLNQICGYMVSFQTGQYGSASVILYWFCGYEFTECLLVALPFSGGGQPRLHQQPPSQLDTPAGFILDFLPGLVKANTICHSI